MVLLPNPYFTEAPSVWIERGASRAVFLRQKCEYEAMLLVIGRVNVLRVLSMLLIYNGQKDY